MSSQSAPVFSHPDRSDVKGIDRVAGGTLPAAENEIERQDAQLGDALQMTFPASDPIAVFVPERSRDKRHPDNLPSPEAGQERDHTHAR
jgi:hypothetical protein